MRVCKRSNKQVQLFEKHPVLCMVCWLLRINPVTMSVLQRSRQITSQAALVMQQ